MKLVMIFLTILGIASCSTSQKSVKVSNTDVSIVELDKITGRIKSFVSPNGIKSDEYYKIGRTRLSKDEIKEDHINFKIKDYSFKLSFYKKNILKDAFYSFYIKNVKPSHSQKLIEADIFKIQDRFLYDSDSEIIDVQ
ncbi:hypothetical protein A9Q84_00135 [Halobacteriovorax marinus]|uniref:Lipoprotein n=1 Tax=Halobacteriovorax marinus TaxID=97084 RepID=A0A1Y5FJS2_9BACT|nr:hypothetical protein A9Q84_00135 [Halobacteriovorax marinus]